MTGMIQFGLALAELNVEIIYANSSQATGRVERANRTFQDRLVTELRIAGISNMDDDDACLAGFIKRYSTKFAKAPAKPYILHHTLNIEPDRIAQVFFAFAVHAELVSCVGRSLPTPPSRKRSVGATVVHHERSSKGWRAGACPSRLPSAF